jgi:hypothetical protein
MMVSVANPGGPGTIPRRLWIYNELLRAEAHWTSQIQNQQTRIATTLSVNGIMLAFIAGEGGFIGYSHLGGVAKALLVASVACLAIGVVLGLAALWPHTRIGGGSDLKQQNIDYFLSSDWLGKEALNLSEGDLLAQLSGSLQPGRDEKAGKRRSPKDTLDTRRPLIEYQLLMIGLAAILITVLLPATLFHW